MIYGDESEVKEGKGINRDDWTSTAKKVEFFEKHGEKM